MDDCLSHIGNSNCILSSSTSAICSSLFAEGLKSENRILISHPINPPFAIPLVEIVPHPKTLTEVTTFTRNLMVPSYCRLKVMKDLKNYLTFFGAKYGVFWKYF